MFLKGSSQILVCGKDRDGWENVALGEICEKRSELVQPSQDGKTAFVGLEHIDSGKMKPREHASDTHLTSTKFKFYPNDILYGKLRPYLDKAAKVDFSGICSTDLLVLSCRENVVTEFLLYIIHSKKFVRHAITTTSGTNHPRTSWDDISRFEFGLPPISEQKAIVGVLGVVDSAIELADRVIARTERLKKGLMQQLLTRGIGHTEYKDTPIGKIPAKWQTMKLRDVLELCQYGLSVKFGNKGKYRILKMDDIENGVAFPDNAKYVDLDEKTFTHFQLEKGDILFNRTNSYELVGRTGIFTLDGDYTFASYLIRLRPKKELVDPQFLTFYLIYSNDRLRQLATRAVHQANINATNLQSFTIIIPSLSEQKKAAEIIVTLDRKLELERNEKAKLESIKQGLMDLLLTGKVRIKVD